MTKLGPYEVHPFADAFPLVEGEEFEELAADIKRNGLREPILLNHDKTVLIDGRNRYRACEASGADPVFETLPGRYTEMMILDLIVSKNLARRHMNAGQKAFVGLEYERYYVEAIKAEETKRKTATVGDRNSRLANALSNRTEAGLPQSRAPQASDRAAQIVGSSGRTVRQAKAVQRDAPDLAEQVRAGHLALDAADKRRRERVRYLPRPEPVKTGVATVTLRTHNGAPVEYPRPQSKATFNETKGDGISWAGWSWNPVTGCLHGCDYCYARAITARWTDAYPAGFTPVFHHAPDQNYTRLDAPANTVIPAAHRDNPAYQRVFVCSMADLYGRWVPDEWITKVHDSMLASPAWQYILLTKFPARYVGLDMPPGAWIGTSVDEQKRVRIAEDAFRQIDGGMVKWLSLEPLREPLEFTDLSMFDWVVIGGQTETLQPTGRVEARQPEFDWVHRIYAQAREAGCRVHMKPNLVNGKPGMQLPDEYPEG